MMRQGSFPITGSVAMTTTSQSDQSLGSSIKKDADGNSKNGTNRDAGDEITRSGPEPCTDPDTDSSPNS